MTDISKHHAEDDPDVPLTDEEFERGRIAMLVRSTRKATGLSQEAFAKAYQIGLPALRNWEQGRRKPGETTISLFKIIRAEPQRAREILLERA
ncbi:MAG: helix-turn-helix domain-containing protein [Alphaproteobacteria bacterium]